ncbi:hypothetical protein CEP54_015045 [Fusarium duplospermum]|uniref:Xylanolytic transcriptional activator regulatory domain-containing protein n=1 Tax=Fusarium duplospermum TaxID=1325734 RepID=A0A428NS31_9HYPO|nr:hypothetical protein CEP54_015045 [Fusarium duplospermum]
MPISASTLNPRLGFTPLSAGVASAMKRNWWLNKSAQRQLHMRLLTPAPRRCSAEMIQLFNTYRHRVHPSQLVLDDLDEVEKVVCSLIGRDSSQEQNDSDCLCLLHAILAAGAQFSDLAPSARVQKSQKHLKHALSFLGAFQYLWNPSKRLLQALVILGHVLQNDMNPRGAWVLGGTTIRLALSMGLHQPVSAQDSFRLSAAEAQHLR